MKDLDFSSLGSARRRIFFQSRFISQTGGSTPAMTRFVIAFHQVQKMSVRNPTRLIVDDAVRWNGVARGESIGWIVNLGERNGTADERADSRGDLNQAFIKQGDFLPFGAPGFRAAGVDGLNRGFELKAAKTFEVSGEVQKFLGLLDEFAGPFRRVRLVERDELAVAGVTRLTPRLTMQHQGEQAVRLGFARHQQSRVICRGCEQI